MSSDFVFFHLGRFEHARKTGSPHVGTRVRLSHKDFDLDPVAVSYHQGPSDAHVFDVIRTGNKEPALLPIGYQITSLFSMRTKTYLFNPWRNTWRTLWASVYTSNSANQVRNDRSSTDHKGVTASLIFNSPPLIAATNDMSSPSPPTTPMLDAVGAWHNKLTTRVYEEKDYYTLGSLYPPKLRPRTGNFDQRATMKKALEISGKQDLAEMRPVYSDPRKPNEGELPLNGRTRDEMRQVAKETEDPAVAEEFAALLSHMAADHRIAFRAQASQMYEGQAIRVRRKWAATDPTIADHLFQSLMNYAFVLAWQQRHAEAVEATHEAIVLQRQLLETSTSTNSDSDPSATKRLADSLENFSVHLSSVGRPKEALRAQEEAVEVWRTLTLKDHNLKDGLVSALDDYSSQLSSLGRHDDAQLALQERSTHVSEGTQPADSASWTCLPTKRFLSSLKIEPIRDKAGVGRRRKRKPVSRAAISREANTDLHKDEDVWFKNPRRAPAARNTIAVIYCATYTTPSVTSSTSRNSTFIQNAPSSGSSISVHDPSAAASWIEDYWDDEILAEVRTNGCQGPVACMLSPDEPALALFLFPDASSPDDTVLDLARDLAECSGYPVMLRDAGDYPDFAVLLDRDAHYQTARVHLNNANADSSGDGTGQEPSRDGDIFREERSAGDPGDDERRPQDVHPGDPDGIGSALQGLDLQPPDGASFGAGGGDGGGGDDGAASSIDANWDSPKHSTKIKLHLKVNEDRTCTVTVGYDFQFSIHPKETSAPVPGDPGLSIFRPEVIARADFHIVTPPGRAAIDRSYASLGFTAHRSRSILRRENIPRGNEAPGRIYNEIRQKKFEKGFQGTAGWSQNSPTVTGTLHARKTETKTISAMDDRVMPNCWVRPVVGPEWDKGDISYSSYNYEYEWQDKLLNYPRAPGEAMEFKVGIGINLRPEGSLPRISFVTQNQTLIWVSDPKTRAKTRGILVLMNSPFNNIQTSRPQYIDEEQEIDLQRGSPVESEGLGKPGTISLSIAQVEKPAPRRLPRLTTFKFYKPISHPMDLTLREYLVRGWDVDQEKWGRVIGWPDLDKDFHAAYESDPVWTLKFPDM
ncbi:hypothetical protein FB45DRAFT_1060692 [Roridomyces roridus]|uniref:Uncharacterized protein n=1 Tax=Roridomyces roridus TaxID=1738132 RepID=A0AAD7BKW3_9AGAR|nr:hypothetical protein FB45DRAFT_1060692 [Roridomyces roridus]